MKKMTLDDFYNQVEGMNLRCDIRERVLTIVNDAHCAAYDEGHKDGDQEGYHERAEYGE